MYGLNRLSSANHLRALHTTAAAAPYPIRLHRRINPPLGSFSSSAGIDDFVYVGKGHKICGKDEIEGSISDLHNTYKWKFKNNKKHAYRRKVLPPKLHSTNVARLTCESAADGGICDVYLVGTNHSCVKSWREAQAVVMCLKPQVVFLELCSDRINCLTRQKDKVPTLREMLDMWKKKEDPFWILHKWFKAKLGSKFNHDVEGGEFRVAYEEATKYGGKVILGDRPSHITERRMLAKMSLWKYLFHPDSVPNHFFKTAKDELDIANIYLRELCRKFPDYAEVIIHERDRYMSAKILKVAREHSSVVAIVGWGHLAGIQKNWKQPVDMEQLLDTGRNTFTIGKKLSSIGAMVFYLCISARTVDKIERFLSEMYFEDEDDV